MNISEEIQKLCDQIAREFHPDRILLFGSHAYGEPTEDSDVDLLVVMPFKGSSRQQAVNIRSRIDTAVPLDLLVRTPEEISERLALGDFFMRDVTENGKVLYEADHARVD